MNKTAKSSWRSKKKQTLIFQDYQQENLCEHNFTDIDQCGQEKQNGAATWPTQSFFMFRSVFNSNKPNKDYQKQSVEEDNIQLKNL